MPEPNIELSDELKKLLLRSEDQRHASKFVHDMLLGQDNLAIVIRGHLYFESALNRLIEESLREPSEIDVERLTFRLKTELALALEAVPRDLKQPLLLVNSLRNRLAHDIDAEITAKDTNNLFNFFTKHDRERIGADARSNLLGLFGFLFGRLHGKVLVKAAASSAEEKS